jgi:hypothetical protein
MLHLPSPNSAIWGRYKWFGFALMASVAGALLIQIVAVRQFQAIAVLGPLRDLSSGPLDDQESIITAGEIWRENEVLQYVDPLPIGEEYIELLQSYDLFLAYVRPELATGRLTEPENSWGEYLSTRARLAFHYDRAPRLLTITAIGASRETARALLTLYVNGLENYIRDQNGAKARLASSSLVDSAKSAPDPGEKAELYELGSLTTLAAERAQSRAIEPVEVLQSPVSLRLSGNSQLLETVLAACLITIIVVIAIERIAEWTSEALVEDDGR